MDNNWEHRFINTNGIRLHVAQAGPEAGPLVILLHGFPEFWYGWRHQVDALAQAGYRVWVPDQRGYNGSDKPKGISAYTLPKLGGDILGLMDVAGQEKARIIGHDWGANVAWWLALNTPQRVERLGILNVPHPAVFLPHIRRHPRQMLRSWYVLFFQLPWLPEWLSRRGNWQMPAQSMLRSSRPNTFSPADMNAYRQAWSQPGAYTAMLNWYRALIQRPIPPPSSSRVTVPTLMLWGANDVFLDRELAQASIDLCDRGELVYFEEATHWLHHEEPERVNFLLETFLSRTM